MNLRRALLRRPAPATRYPADPRAVFILALCVVTGVPALLARVKPGTLEDLMPTWVIVIWGLSLVIGAVVTLAGMSKQTTTGIIAEQIGSVTVGAATVFYAGAIFLTAGLMGAFSGAIVLGFGLSCFWRWGQLQSLLTQGARIVAEYREGQ